MILVVFHTAGINEKNIYIIIMKKKFWYRTWMGYCPSELKAGLGAGARRARWERQAWARRAQASARAERHGMARGARRQLGRRAHGRAQQARGHGMDGRGARQAQAGARGAAGWAACAHLVCAAGPGWVFCCT